MTFATTANITSVVETGGYFVHTVICTIIWESFPMSLVNDMKGELMSDLISRQAAIDACHDYEDGEGAYAYGFIVEERLRNLPSAQPDLSEYSDKLWRNAYERGKRDAQPEQDREFIKLTVRNSNGRPYYSIIYLEVDDNGIGHDFEGYSSYSLDVISDYLKKYFMPSAQPRLNKKRISDLLWNEYRTMSPHLSAEGVVARRYYCKELWKELFGEEETPVWMT
jgi:hypothetical protein